MATPQAREEALLTVRKVTLRFGGLTSLSEVDLSLYRGEIRSVIGPNGAGKTSLFNCLTGVYTPQEGTIEFITADGTPTQLVSGPPRRRRSRKPHVVNRAGIARTFQNIRLFAALSAFENVKIAAETRQRTGPIGAMLRLPHARANERRSDARTRELLDFVGLRQVADELASSLPYGVQRRLEIARALATDPALLLLDEPAAGTNPTEKRQLEGLIRRINTDLGVTVLLIEHDMKLVMSVADRVTVLNFGRVIAEGRPEEVQRDPVVVEAYLGSTEEKP
ncbi:branched-chain amino acid transport system ATP-binding protein [Kitasatospora sp. MAA4]|uniref:ABC transporter ATP-binding protein n=1 Tax=Kitasatospora sp. MAA4 TaxID=3035093 RepID=UPI002474917B|nr:ABC transporter ATP-binding protein [Kitasatospora sp. MAA4]MDH6134568.1 branched-chain amino acid transport system ATP-binding protein [Kitasatospora sp. MAA4]